ncbi:MAG: GTPase HflX [Alphaproteobacteria bacterium]|nr:GTPase HflX [Alphaproteobacteria bacterium]
MKLKLPGFDTNKNHRSKAAVVFPSLPNSTIQLSPEARLEEACGLALAINLDVVFADIAKLRQIKPSVFLGQGYLEKLEQVIKEKEIELLILDISLTPIQQRNLEKRLNVKVIDRTALILEIFGERAKTREGKLQVELAHLNYQRSRLVRSWTHLERQRGGAGFLGGPGETQIELDRRIIDDKIVKIKKELEKVKQTRALQRHARKKIPYPVVALVGYTNAGKSSLFNRLANSDVFAKDLLFATLDPTMRRIKLPSGREVILSDTVGFISDLPHELIMSFRATLEEVLEADLVVHVRDIANPNSGEQKKDVLGVLSNLGLEEIEQQDKYVEILNKIDLLSPEEREKLFQMSERRLNVIPASAVTGEGTIPFLQLIDDKLSAAHIQTQIKLPAANGQLISWVYANAKVLDSHTQGETILLDIKINAVNLSKLETKLSQ